MIEEYRKKIDKIDDEITQLLLQRLNYVIKIGKEKQKNKIAILDKNREDKIKKRLSKFTKNDCQSKYVLKIFDSIMDESKRVQH